MGEKTVFNEDEPTRAEHNGLAVQHLNHLPREATEPRNCVLSEPLVLSSSEKKAATGMVASFDW